MRQVAFITGASGDIGRAIAVQLAKDGYAVALGFNNNEKAANSLSAQLKWLVIFPTTAVSKAPYPLSARSLAASVCLSITQE